MKQETNYSELDVNSNYILNKEEFKKKITNLSSYPYRLYVELTRNCNLKCKMCSRSSKKFDLPENENLHMDFNLFKRIADELFPYANFVDLRGFGESTLIPNFLEYVNYTSKFNCNLGIITNLTLKNDELWKSLIKKNFWIGISIDGPNRRIYGKIRNYLYYDRVIKNTRLLVESSIKFNTDINRIYFLVVVQKDNVNHLLKLVELAYKLGIKRIEFKPVRSRFSTIWLKDIQDITKKQVKKCIEFAGKAGIDLRLTGFFFDKKFEESLGYKIMKECTRPWSHIFITYNGLVGPCNHKFDLTLGDLNDHEFKEIWNNNAFKKFREKINTQNRDTICDYCFNYSYDNQYS